MILLYLNPSRHRTSRKTGDRRVTVTRLLSGPITIRQLINVTNTWRMPVLDPAELPTLGHLFRLHCWVHAAHVSPKHVKLHTRHIYRAPNLTGRQAGYCENHMFHSFPFHSRLKPIHADGMFHWNAAHADLPQS